MAFIPIDKIKKLREDAKNGNEKALNILRMQMNNEDFSELLNQYFQDNLNEQNMNSVENNNNDDIQDEKLKKFLEYNGVKKGDMDYDSTVEAYYKEFPKAKPNNAQKVVETKATDADDENYSIYDEEDELENNDHDKHQEEEMNGKNFLDVLIDDEIEAINGYNSAIMEVMNLDMDNESARKGIIADLEEIKKDEIEHLEKLKRMKNALIKKKTEELENSTIE